MYATRSNLAASRALHRALVRRALADGYKVATVRPAPVRWDGRSLLRRAVALASVGVSIIRF